MVNTKTSPSFYFVNNQHYYMTHQELIVKIVEDYIAGKIKHEDFIGFVLGAQWAFKLLNNEK